MVSAVDTISAAIATKPELEALRGELQWKLRRAGTCSAVHLKRLEFEKLGTLALDREKVSLAFPGMAPGRYAAVNDISIANQLNVAWQVSPDKMPMSEGVRTIGSGSSRGASADPEIVGLDGILAS